MSLLTSRARSTWRRWNWVGLGILFFCIQLATAQLNNETSPTHQFKSRPDLHAPIIKLEVYEPELVTPGYIFFGPYRNVDPGPYIYDNAGNLVWSGAGEIGPKVAHAPRVCQYRGEDHLCFFTGEQHQGFARGHGVIMDKHYRVVKQIDSSGAGASSDMHEFKITPYSNEKTVLMTVYQPRQYDITVNPWWNLQNGMGWICEGVFQEIAIETGKVVFEWRSLDHVDPGEAWTLPSTTDTSGTGLHETEPWDYFHLNSIDKNKDGDYLISARHVSAIYKISGKDGSIMWQLGGSSGQFEQTNFIFSYQHHARWMSENKTHTLFSFYDNASNNFNTSGNFSHGMVVSIDHLANTATMIQEYGAPELEGGLRSASQGNMQILPNGGYHIGWGEHPYYSEHTASGQAVLYAKVAERASDVMIYRSNKYNWTAQPVTKPALWTFSKYGANHMAFYVSWNGATEVRSWRFYISNTPNGPWVLVGNVWKTGFETEHHVDTFARWAYAEAVDEAGKSLDTSVIARTFVPSERLREFCDDRDCKYAEPVPHEEIVPYEDKATVVVDEEYISSNRGFDTTNYYQDLPESDRVDHGKSTRARRIDVAWWTAFVSGLVSGAITLCAVRFGFLVWQQGSWDSVRERWEHVRERMSSGSFGSSLSLGSYTPLQQKEMSRPAGSIPFS